MLHRVGLLGAVTIALALVPSGCARREPTPAPVDQSPAAPLPDPEPPSDDPAPIERAVRRGFGAVTARVPGTSEVVSGVRVVSHRVHVVIRDGFARTEIEEELANDTPRVLEGRYVFPVPPDASLSRLGLWVDKELVEGEIVERERAAAIFKGIVDDVVRPRDPALLEWVRGSEVSLKIFPMPARGTRKVVLAYDQVLRSKGGRMRYVYPLSLGEDRTATIDDFEIRVRAPGLAGPIGDPDTPSFSAASVTRDVDGIAAGFRAHAFAPRTDFVLTFQEPAERAPDLVVPASYVAAPREGADRFAAVRVPIAWPAGVAPPPDRRLDRAVVIDVSHSQSADTLASEIAAAEAMIAALGADERFVILACDSACAAFPEDGLAAAAPARMADARAWLGARSAGGSSDIAGALRAAAMRLPPSGSGQIVMIGDGAPTSGELTAEAIAARVKPEIAARGIDVRLVGAGRTVDAVVLEGLARALGASFERLDDGEPLARRLADLAPALRAPILRDVAIAASGGLRDVYPRVVPALPVGSSVVVLARMAEGEAGEVRVSGDLGGAAFTTTRQVSAPDTSPVVPRLWAAARIAELEASADPSANAEVIALSKRHHVLSRRTSLLVLENDRMFAQFGIPRTQGAYKPLDDPPPTSAGSAAAAAQDFGMIGLIGRGSASGHGRAMGSSAPMSSWGMQQRADDGDLMSAMQRSTTFGAGGLGLSGIGVGAGGQGDKKSEVVAPADGGQGLAAGFGRLRGTHVPRPPNVRMGSSSVSGRLPPEVVSRSTRQHFGRLRACYESGLRSNPNLAGRVSVRFVIGRDGGVVSAQNAGSDLPDAAVVACVVRVFQGLRFPQPEGGIVVVVYPVVFSPEAPPTPSRPTWQPSFQAGPTAAHAPGDDRWMSAGSDAIDKLEKAVGADGASRRQHEALIRGLIKHGRFPLALAAAKRFADLDPDSGRALELYAGAAAAAGEPAVARTAIDALVELSPDSADLHARAARAFEAAGDEARACAHWRSIASLRPGSDDARYQAWRCRARLGERDAVLAEASALDKPAKPIAALSEALAAGSAPAYDAALAGMGTFEVTVRCEDEPARCPFAVIVKPDGTVVSPWSPSSSRVSDRSVALLGGLEGTYRTLLVGGAPDARGDVVVRAHGASRTFRFDRGGLQTIASTTVTGSSWGRFR